MTTNWFGESPVQLEILEKCATIVTDVVDSMIMEDKAFNNGDNSDDSKDGNVSTTLVQKEVSIEEKYVLLEKVTAIVDKISILQIRNASVGASAIIVTPKLTIYSKREDATSLSSKTFAVDNSQIKVQS